MAAANGRDEAHDADSAKELVARGMTTYRERALEQHGPFRTPSPEAVPREGGGLGHEGVDVDGLAVPAARPRVQHVD